MKKAALIFCSFLCLFLFGCRAVEPEEVYLVSAVGFDKIDDRVRFCIEVPLTRESETDRMELRIFEGEGESVGEALCNLKNGLARQLELGHCALVVLGEGIEGERLATVLQSVTELQIPLSVTVVSSPKARELLSQGSLSAPAAGYEIPDILQLLEAGQKEPFKCRLYEIAAANGNFEIPQFLPEGQAAAGVDRYTGLCKFREGRRVLP